MFHCSFRNIPLMLRRLFRIRNQYLKEFLAEMFGTLILVLCGTSAIAQKLFAGDLPIDVYASFGFGFAIAGLIFGKVSGKN